MQNKLFKVEHASGDTKLKTAHFMYKSGNQQIKRPLTGIALNI
jgi:hypothetical protein